MKSCAFVLIFSFSYVYSVTNDTEDLSAGDKIVPFAKLPVDVQSNFYDILTGLVNYTARICSGIELDYDKVEFLLYTNDTEVSTKLDPTNPVGIDYNANLFLLSHGWLSGVNGNLMNAFRNKYIELYGKNIIFINWGKIAWIPYHSAVCNMPFIAQHVANFLCNLNEKNKYDLKNVHMIGHSFGGQLSGLTGKAVQKTCRTKMGRITALDPAGPVYKFVAEEDRLAPTDAEFVEVVHSNMEGFGYKGKCGIVNYHLNGGEFLQPGCIIINIFADFSQYTLFQLMCEHLRSVEIWPYVLGTDQFKGKSCKAYSVFCIEDTHDGADFVSMGHTNTTPKSEHYNVITRQNAPFYLGCKPYPSQECK